MDPHLFRTSWGHLLRNHGKCSEVNLCLSLSLSVCLSACLPKTVIRPATSNPPATSATISYQLDITVCVTNPRLPQRNEVGSTPCSSERLRKEDGWFRLRNGSKHISHCPARASYSYTNPKGSTPPCCVRRKDLMRETPLLPAPSTRTVRNLAESKANSTVWEKTPPSLSLSLSLCRVWLAPSRPTGTL